MEQENFRKLAKELYDRVFNAFEEYDPDEVEADYNLDNISILFNNGTKFIINSQPFVNQIWLATKNKGYHFNYNTKEKKWFCDKTGSEFYSLLANNISETLGTLFEFSK